MRTYRSLAPALLTLLAFGCGDASPSGSGVRVKVLTWNLYLGAELVPLALVPTPAGIPDVAAEMWAEVQASDFPARAKVIAARIAELAPDFVALQEVTLYRKQATSDFAADPRPNATTVELDFLDLVLDELAARGAPYDLAFEAPNADVELPVSDGAGGLFDLRVTDRDAILAKRGVNANGGVQNKFSSTLAFTAGGTGGVRLEFTRSESHVTAMIPPDPADARGGSPFFTFANSHLEVGAVESIQQDQGNELLGFLSPVTGPVLLLGDFNSPPGGKTYQALTKTFRDQAASLPAPATDFTCCQASDLMNATSTAGERIDLVLARGNFTMKSARPVGNDPVLDRTPSGKWASDHFGVFAELELR
jgi:endonuclease/exonuclease/phosphatase family metal-dependent hydrolase